MLFHKLDKYRDIGLLILRIGIGIIYLAWIPQTFRRT